MGAGDFAMPGDLTGASVRFVGSSGDERLGVVLAVDVDGMIQVAWDRFGDLEARFVAGKRKPSEHEQASIGAHTSWVYAPGHLRWPAGSKLEIA